MSAGSPKEAGEPRLSATASWAVLAASFGLSASTWVALAQLAGFTGEAQIFGATLLLAWLMPICVDGYVVVALVLWMSPVPQRVAAFARVNTYLAAGVGVVAQSAYHCLLIWTSTGVHWRAVMAAVVGALPPLVAGLSVHMRALLIRESGRRSTVVEREAERVPAEQVAPAPVPVPVPAVVVAPMQPPAALPPVDAPTVTFRPDTTPEVQEAVRGTQVAFVAPPEPPVDEAADDPAEVTTEAALDPLPDGEVEKAPGSASASAPPATPKRTTEETRRLASALLTGDPTLTRTKVAETLGISTRRLRDILPPDRNLTAVGKVNGHDHGAST